MEYDQAEFRMAPSGHFGRAFNEAKEKGRVVYIGNLDFTFDILDIEEVVKTMTRMHCTFYWDERPPKDERQKHCGSVMVEFKTKEEAEEAIGYLRWMTLNEIHVRTRIYDDERRNAPEEAAYTPVLAKSTKRNVSGTGRNSPRQQGTASPVEIQLNKSATISTQTEPIVAPRHPRWYGGTAFPFGFGLGLGLGASAFLMVLLVFSVNDWQNRNYPL